MAAWRVRLTDAEFAVLEPLWRSGPQTIRQLTAALYPQQSVSDYATVQKLLERLEAKRCVRRDRSQPAHVFRATIERDALIDGQLQEIADRLCDGSLVPVLNQLVRRTRLSAQDRERLRKLLDEGGKQ
ncbi:MAG: BlaI/MecI/CopY family transcriptional regulator [Pirellulales bacterium]